MRDSAIPSTILPIVFAAFAAYAFSWMDFRGRQWLFALLVGFRSLLVPLKAVIMNLLSIGAANGINVAIFQWGWLGEVFGVHNPGPVLNFAPIIVMGVLFGLAMDYQLFLGSGMREAYAHGAPSRVAIVQGVRAGRAVVTAAAIIMISVFGGFIFAEDAMIRPIGFALAIGVVFLREAVTSVRVGAILLVAAGLALAGAILLVDQWIKNQVRGPLDLANRGPIEIVSFFDLRWTENYGAGGVSNGPNIQFTVPAGTWMGGRVAAGGSWTLFGCTMAPGFTFAGYEHGDAAELTAREAAGIRR